MRTRALHFVAALQVLLLMATLVLPGLVAAEEPSPSPDATPTEQPSDPPTAEPTAPDPTPAPTPDTTPEPPAATDVPPYAPSGPPTISSNKADYAPGELVTLSGTNWAAGESVHIYVNDELGSSWSRNIDVTAGSGGTVVDQFNLPNWFVSNYVVVATGPSSGTALASFTDGNATLHLAATEGVANMTVTFDRWNGNSTCTGTAGLTNQTVAINASSGTVNIPGFGGSGDSVLLKSVATTTSGKTFSSWTNGDKSTDLGTLTPGSPTPCISNSGGGTNGN